MDILLDNKETEIRFQKILNLIKSRKNGDVADSMNQKGINYKLNWGVSIPDLRDIAKMFEKEHLLALKLWNKQWRETMILATLLDNPTEVTEEQMDFWTKSFENAEIAEQASSNLWVKSKYAFIKSLEWCRGKKHLVRFTGVHLMGRLALTEKAAIDEMFEPFFDELLTLSKDKKLFTPLYRAIILLGKRSDQLYKTCIELTKQFQSSESELTRELGKLLIEEFTSPYFTNLASNS